MIELKIHVRFCEEMFDLLNRQLDLRDQKNSILSQETDESVLSRKIYEFILKHKKMMDLNGYDILLKREIEPEIFFGTRGRFYQGNDFKPEKKSLSKSFSSSQELFFTKMNKKRIENIIKESLKQSKLKKKNEVSKTQRYLISPITKEVVKSRTKIRVSLKPKKMRKSTPFSKPKAPTQEPFWRDQPKVIEEAPKQLPTPAAIGSESQFPQKETKKRSRSIKKKKESEKLKQDTVKQEVKKEEEEKKEKEEEEKENLSESQEKSESDREKEMKEKILEQRRLFLYSKNKILSEITHEEKKNPSIVLSKEEMEKMRIENEQVERIRDLIRKEKNDEEIFMRELKKKTIRLEDLLFEKDESKKKKHMKILKLSQEINYLIEEDKEEKPKVEGPSVYEEFKEKILSLKKCSPETYLAYIDENFNEIKEELEEIKMIKKKEREINEFIRSSRFESKMVKQKRETLIKEMNLEDCEEGFSSLPFVEKEKEKEYEAMLQKHMFG